MADDRVCSCSIHKDSAGCSSEQCPKNCDSSNRDEKGIPTSNVNKELLEKVISKCFGLVENKEHEKIREKIWSAFKIADTEYLKSTDFKKFLDITIDRLHDDPTNVFVHVLELRNELKAHKQYSYSSKTKVDTKVDKQKTATNINADSKSEKRILKLEKIMMKLEKKIERLKKEEMSLDDLGNETSVYILLDKYVKKFNDAWKIYCKLTARGTGTGRPVQRSIKYNGTRFPEVNEYIEKYMNKHRNVFPDFCDVHHQVVEVNDAKHLGLRHHQTHDLAVEIFEDIGKILKFRREQDFCHNSMYVFEPEQADPAEVDAELNSTLLEQTRIGNAKLNDVFSNYTELQILKDIEPEEVGDNFESGNNSDDEDDASSIENDSHSETDEKDPNNLENDDESISGINMDCENNSLALVKTDSGLMSDNVCDDKTPDIKNQFSDAFNVKSDSQDSLMDLNNFNTKINEEIENKFDLKSTFDSNGEVKYEKRIDLPSNSKVKEKIENKLESKDVHDSKGEVKWEKKTNCNSPYKQTTYKKGIICSKNTLQFPAQFENSKTSDTEPETIQIDDDDISENEIKTNHTGKSWTKNGEPQLNISIQQSSSIKLNFKSNPSSRIVVKTKKVGGSIAGGQNSINVSRLPSGLYFENKSCQGSTKKRKSLNIPLDKTAKIKKVSKNSPIYEKYNNASTNPNFSMINLPQSSSKSSSNENRNKSALCKTKGAIKFPKELNISVVPSKKEPNSEPEIITLDDD